MLLHDVHVPQDQPNTGIGDNDAIPVSFSSIGNQGPFDTGVNEIPHVAKDQPTAPITINNNTEISGTTWMMDTMSSITSPILTTTTPSPTPATGSSGNTLSSRITLSNSVTPGIITPSITTPSIITPNIITPSSSVALSSSVPLSGTSFSIAPSPTNNTKPVLIGVIVGGVVGGAVGIVTLLLLFFLCYRRSKLRRSMSTSAILALSSEEELGISTNATTIDPFPVTFSPSVNWAVKSSQPTTVTSSRSATDSGSSTEASPAVGSSSAQRFDTPGTTRETLDRRVALPADKTAESVDDTLLGGFPSTATERNAFRNKMQRLQQLVTQLSIEMALEGREGESAITSSNPPPYN